MKNILSVIFVLIAGAISTLDAKPAPGVTRTTETCGDPTLAVPFHRLYDASIAHHLYCTGVANTLAFDNTHVWTYQALAAFVFVTQEESTVPLHQMVNPTTADRIYTTNATEVTALEKTGYGVAALEPGYFIYPTQICGSVPFYRLSKVAIHDHFFTASETERIAAIDSQGYADEGIAGYVFAPEPTQC
ncbi:hypothetical protein B0H16DRAFT_1892332 [Mycena metata]|uniref:DUF5648 domain-containing protein n=1 Tax=Mycena metata TaxID=1033252 RepID=A0AAD7MVX3_9AGAR|nr:hypothetical protein B0H16DRAFT_1892332 [Mycena metata]